MNRIIWSIFKCFAFFILIVQDFVFFYKIKLLQSNNIYIKLYKQFRRILFCSKMFFDYMMTGFKSKPANDDEMIILNGKYSNKSIRFPYKPFYGLDRTLNCSQSIYSNFDHCEIQAQLEWDIRINGYVRKM